MPDFKCRDRVALRWGSFVPPRWQHGEVVGTAGCDGWLWIRRDDGRYTSWRQECVIPETEICFESSQIVAKFGTRVCP